jgi:hypothetical protein
MSDFDTIGFLSSDLDRLEDDIRSAYPDWYSLTMKVNTFCQRLQYDLEFRSDDANQVIAATLFARAVTTYQAFIILSTRGMPHQASMILRCLIECVFLLVAISKNPDYSRKIADSDQHDYKRSRKNLKQFLERHNPDHQGIGIIQDQIKETSQKIDENNCKPLKIRLIARDAGLEDWYDTVYCSLCEPVHSSIRSLEELLKFNNNQKITYLENHPNTEDLGILFLTGSNIMLFAIEGISAILNKDTSSFTDNLRKTLPKFRSP